MTQYLNISWGKPRQYKPKIDSSLPLIAEEEREVAEAVRSVLMRLSRKRALLREYPRNNSTTGKGL